MLAAVRSAFGVGSSTPSTPQQPRSGAGEFVVPSSVYDGRSQAERDEDLAFQMTLKQLEAADMKDRIAREDEETAMNLQFGGAEKEGKHLYARYPGLDLIKGDEAFFPAAAVLGVPSTPASSVPSTPVQRGNYASSVSSPAPASVPVPRWHETPAPLRPPPPTRPLPPGLEDALRAGGMSVRTANADALYGSTQHSSAATTPGPTPLDTPLPTPGATPLPTPAATPVQRQHPNGVDHWAKFEQERSERVLQQQQESAKRQYTRDQLLSTLPTGASTVSVTEPEITLTRSESTVPLLSPAAAPLQPAPTPPTPK
jgi:hypothetical protein